MSRCRKWVKSCQLVTWAVWKIWWARSAQVGRFRKLLGQEAPQVGHFRKFFGREKNWEGEKSKWQHFETTFCTLFNVQYGSPSQTVSEFDNFESVLEKFSFLMLVPLFSINFCCRQNFQQNICMEVLRFGSSMGGAKWRTLESVHCSTARDGRSRRCAPGTHETAVGSQTTASDASATFSAATPTDFASTRLQKSNTDNHFTDQTMAIRDTQPMFDVTRKM